MASEKLFNFTTIFSDSEQYESVKQELKDLVLSDYPSRNNPAKIQVGSQIVDATIGRVLINLVVMKILVEKGIDLSEEDLFSFEAVTGTNLNDYFNSILGRTKKIDISELRMSVSETINELSDLSSELSVLSGNSISYLDFIRLAVEDPKANELFNQHIDDHVEFSAVEDKFESLSHEIADYFLSRKDSELYPFMVAETGINKKQLTQAIGFVGLKPDIDGSIIPVTISDNYLTGLSNLESYFINSKGTRKALITNSRMVRKSGYLTRKLSLALIDRYHDHDNEDCGTTHFVKYDVVDQKHLDQINERHYYDLDEKGEKAPELKTVDTKDSSLIGKTIGLRSPITCAGDKVCRTCYGTNLSTVNKNLNTGLISILLLTNPLTQKLLSAKHLLTTNTEKIEWDSKFSEFFSVNMNAIHPAHTDFSVSFPRIPRAEWDEDEDQPYTDYIEIYDGAKKLFEYDLPVRFYYDFDNFWDESSKIEEKIVLKSKDYTEMEPMFTFLAKNNELTKSLQEVLDLIESNGHLGIDNYHDLTNKFNDLLIVNGLNMMSVHAEMISSVLIKDQETNKRPDFSFEDIPDYTIVRVSKAVLDSPLSVSLAFERLDEQLINLTTYEKDEESLMDYLYR